MATAVQSPWINGIPKAASYACMRPARMRQLVKSGKVLSRLKPEDEDGHRPVGVLVYAPSIDQLIMEQPSGACEMSQALSS